MSPLLCWADKYRLHELETIYERVIKGQLNVTPQIVQSIRLIQDDVADRIQLIREKSIDYPAEHVLNVLQNIDQQLEITETENGANLTARFTFSCQAEAMIFELANR